MPQENYVVSAYGMPDSIDLSLARSLYSQLKPNRIANDCLHLEASDDQHIFIYDFGAVAFLNFQPEKQMEHLVELGFGQTPTQLRSKNDEFADDDFAINFGKPRLKVHFNSVDLPDKNIVAIELVARALANSVALDLLQSEAELLTQESEEFVEKLSNKKPLWISRRKIIEFQSKALKTKHQIVNRLSLLYEPAKAWENEQLSKLHTELQENFDIDPRIKNLDLMLELAKEVSSLHLELVNSKRSEILELTIIILIAVEIVQVFW